MPTAITAPVSAGAGYDPALFAQSSVGAPLPDIVGTCTTSGGAVQVRIVAPESGVPDVTVTVTATTTNFTTAGILKYIPNEPGHYRVDVTDVTAAQTVTTFIDVEQSEGV